jgi:hypothetical protein
LWRNPTSKASDTLQCTLFVDKHENARFFRIGGINWFIR